MTPRIAFAPGAALVGRLVRTSLTVAALTCGTGVAAFAQTVPSAPAPVTATTAEAAAQPAAATPATQTTTNTNPWTLAQTTPAGAPARPTVPTQVGHFPIIDFVVTFSQPGAPLFNRPGVNQYHAYDPIDLGGTVRIPLTKSIYYAFDRVTEGTLNQAVERVIVPAPQRPGTATGTIYPGVSRDIVLQNRLDWQVTRQLLAEAGMSFRHRLYANDGSGVSNTPFLCAAGGTATASGCTVSSTEHHFGYFGLTYTTKPWKELLRSTFVLNLTGDAQNVDHHVAVTCSAGTIAQINAGYATVNGCRNAAGVPTVAATTVGYLDENPTQSRYYETTQGVQWNIPLDIKRRTTFSMRERWGALNFYENQPFPFRWATANDQILTKVFSPGFTLAMRHSDYHTIQMGTVGVNGSAPFGTFITPNAIHVASWDLIGTFHVDTNSWWH